MSVRKFYSCGKLLLTGEYVVMRGARGLALPTSRGQHLEVEYGERASDLRWVSLDYVEQVWFEATIDTTTMSVSFTSDEKVSERLVEMLQAIITLSPQFKSELKGAEVTTRLEFSNSWGLGSSSTLIHNLAQWAKVDAFDILTSTSNGSGYDIAVAEEQHAIIYERIDDEPYAEQIDFHPHFSSHLWFVHLNKKADTTASIDFFNSVEGYGYSEASVISRLTEQMVVVPELEEFENLITIHNIVMSDLLKLKSSQQVYSEYSSGVTKYLGAWGGDFLLATGSRSDMAYFEQRGHNTILSFDEMILRT